MITNIRECGIGDIVMVLGYLEDRIRDFIAVTFPDLKVRFIINELYAETNTGYSLMLAADAVQGRGFVKFDADVVFDKTILTNLMDSEFETCLCVDTNIQLEAEEVKVAIQENNRITHASKTLNPNDAIGESIGIEKISEDAAGILFCELRLMMKDQINHQEYYEAAYERLIERDVAFYSLDITGLKWVEIDTAEDFSEAKTHFQASEIVPYEMEMSLQSSAVNRQAVVDSSPAIG